MSIVAVTLHVAATIAIVAVASQKKLATCVSRWWAELNEVSEKWDLCIIVAFIILRFIG